MLPEFVMLLFILLLFIYFLAYGFSNVTTEQTSTCVTKRVAGVAVGRHLHVISMLIVFCTICLIACAHCNMFYSLVSERSSIVASERHLHNSMVELFVLTVSLLILFTTHAYNKEIGIVSFEYHLLLLTAMCSFCFFIHATNIMLLYVLIELQSIASYILTAMHKRNRYSVEAGLKYFILGSFSSIVLVFGFSLAYGVSGLLSIEDISIFLRHVYMVDTSSITHIVLSLSFIFIFVGFAFKLYASPFHF